MLNRRIIRGKVLQQIFAYKTCVAANAELCNESIIEAFLPDLNSIEPQDAKKLEGYGKLTLLHFDEYLKTNIQTNDETLPEVVKRCITDSVVNYNAVNKADRNRISKEMVVDTEILADHYALILKVLIELSEKLSEIKKSNKLIQNKVLIQINNNPALGQEWARKNLHWANDQDVIAGLIRQVSLDDEYKNYLKQSVTDFEEDRKIVLHLLKNTILKDPTVNEFFENIHLNWEDDKVAVKDMIVDTVKELVEGFEFSLSPLSKNWEDDKTFMKELFTKTIDNEREYENLISPRLKNWDISRLTTTDNIIIKMCLCEILNFSGIPVKVSINEYIEVSKKYSTPKSKTLINGVLDNLAEELAQNGQVKKSGRGLIDNK